MGGRYVSFGLRGSADILAVADGKFYAIECKSDSGRQSPQQRAYQARVEASGGVYLVVRSAFDLVGLGFKSGVVSP